MAAFAQPPTAATAPHNPNNDYVVPLPPDDSVSALAFSPAAAVGKNYLVASSWNGSARVWDLDPAAGAMPVAEQPHTAPLLDCAWAHDGQAIFTASTDKTAKKWDIASNTYDVVAMHDKAIRHCVDVAGMQLLATGGWDGSVRYWDVRNPTGRAACTVPVGDRVYAMDARNVLLVVGVADRGVLVYDVRNPVAPFQQKYSQLKYQTRAIATFPNSMGYIVASVDGKVSVDHVQEASRKKDQVLKCHRDDMGNSYGINTVCFHDKSGVFATAGSDGFCNFWNLDSRQLATPTPFQKMSSPVCAADFSNDGSLFAYAVGYDWSRGASQQNPAAHPTNIFIRQIPEGGFGRATSAATGINGAPGVGGGGGAGAGMTQGSQSGGFGGFGQGTGRAGGGGGFGGGGQGNPGGQGGGGGRGRGGGGRGRGGGSGRGRRRN
jgi:mRNA export factor